MKKTILLAGLALSLIGGSLAQAQPRGNSQRYDTDRRGQQSQSYDHRDDRSSSSDRRDDRSGQRYDRRADRRYDGGRYQAPRNYRARAWHRGDHLPNGYYSQRYAIADYNRYGLYAPPRGYRWNRVGDDAVLVAITSGLIGAVVSQLFN